MHSTKQSVGIKVGGKSPKLCMIERETASAASNDRVWNSLGGFLNYKCILLIRIPKFTDTFFLEFIEILKT